MTRRYTELRINPRHPVDDATSAPERKIRDHWDSGCDSTNYRRTGFTQRLQCKACDEKL